MAGPESAKAGSPAVIPGWAKVSAAFAAFVIISGAVGGAFLISWFRQQAISAVDPKYINATLQGVGAFGDMSAYHPVVASRFGGMSVVAFDEKDREVQFDIFSYSSPESDPDPVELIDQCYERPVLFPRMTGNFTSIAEKGKADIHGHELYYQTGTLKGGDQKTYKGMIGCLTVGRKVILLVAAALPKQPLDINYLLDFLRKARSF